MARYMLALFTLLFGLPLVSRGQSLDQQAQNQSNVFWNQRIARCGDTTYVGYKDGNVEAFKNGQIRIQPQSLSPTDQLNGWEWRGTTALTATATRLWSVSGGGWQDWTPGAGMGTLRAAMEKRRGVWSIAPDPYGPFSDIKPFSCSQVPPERFDSGTTYVQDAQKNLACKRFMAVNNPWGDYQNAFRGIDVKTCRDDNGRTPLMRSAGDWYPHVEEVRYLLSIGADVNARDNAGETALSLAQKRLYGGSGSYGNDPHQQELAEQVVSLLRNAMSPQPTQGKTAKKKSAAQETVRGSGPEFTLWTGIKNRLTAENGEQYFESSLKNAAVPKLKGTVVGGRPTCNPKELLVAISDASNAEVSVRLQTPLRGMLQPGVQIEWEGVPSAFTKSPFLLTMETVNSKVKSPGMLQVSPCTP